MKLSMYILADCLKEFHPKLQIQEGKQNIQNVRILSDTSKMSRYSAYLSQLDEKHIVLINAHDVIVLEHEDIHQLLDILLDIFEKYNEWANGIYENINDGCIAEILLKGFAELTGNYYLLADPTFYVREQYGSEVFLEKNPFYKEVLHKKIMPVEILYGISRNPKIRKKSVSSYLVHIPEYKRQYCVNNLFVLTDHRGWLVCLKDAKEYSKGEMQLQNEMGRMMEKWLEKNSLVQSYLSISSILIDILENRIENKKIALQRLSGLTWEQNDAKVLYKLSEKNGNEENSYTIDRNLEVLLMHAFVFRYRNELLILINDSITSEKNIEKELQNFLTRYDMYAGKSEKFTDIFDLSDQVDIASAACEYTGDPQHRIVSLTQVRLNYWSHLLIEKSCMDLRHPAIDILKAYDREKHTNLLYTLRIFLQSNHNYKIAAEKLYVHRTTLMYRLERICELTDINLEDYKTQLELNISFMMEEKQCISSDGEL